MHVYFCGISGSAIGPLSLVALKAGYTVSGSDKYNSSYLDDLRSKGIERISIGQSEESIKELHKRLPIDWIVYSSAVPIENPNHPELQFAKSNNIKTSKRNEFINKLLADSGQKMLAIAGTHGKTTTTAMIIWLFKQLELPISYSVGTKMSFGDMGEFNENSDYFIYEADEYDRNFLSFHPAVSSIAGVDYDHPDIYPSRKSYYKAFLDFIDQSDRTVLWEEDFNKLNLSEDESITSLSDGTDLSIYSLIGEVNRKNAHIAVVTLEKMGLAKFDELVALINNFPGVSRRFEKIAENIYSDYAHTPEKIRGALQIAKEYAGKKPVVIYEGLHNTRQHFILDELPELFDGAKKIFIVPSYLAREDENLENLTPVKLKNIIKKPSLRVASELNEELKIDILMHTTSNDIVLCLSAGGSGSLDEWLRKNFKR